MSNNINQILIRNIDAFAAEEPLFINISPDGFIQEYLSTKPKSNVHCYNTDYEAFTHYKINKHITASFTACYSADVKHDLIVISFPKSKEELNFTLTMISRYATSDAHIFIVGENKSGVKSLEKLANINITQIQKVDSARHCLLYVSKLVSNTLDFDLEDWYQYYDIAIDTIQIKIAAIPGVFSHKGLDKGTRVLLENIPDITGNQILDFGCGSGVIAGFIGKKYPKASLNLLDVNALALASAEKTLAINGLSGTVFPSNSLSEIKTTYDTVISNPPFHQGVSTNYIATENFLKGISNYMKKKGELIVVANSFLKYEPIMKSSIGNTQKLNNMQGFTIYRCFK